MEYFWSMGQRVKLRIANLRSKESGVRSQRKVVGGALRLRLEAKI
jgi:hypothetical protein